MWGFTKVIHFFIIIRHVLFNVFIIEEASGGAGEGERRRADC
jgi:hypothetical protein